MAAVAGVAAVKGLAAGEDEAAKLRAAKEAKDKAAQDKALKDKAAKEKADKDKEAQAAKDAKDAKDKQAKAKQASDIEAARAKALLDGSSASAAAAKPAPASAAAAVAAGASASEGRYVVQFGAFAETDKAQEARRKVEKTGLKTYTQVAETPQGKRIRARVGPFATKAEADKAAAKIKALDLPAAVLAL